MLQSRTFYSIMISLSLLSIMISIMISLGLLMGLFAWAVTIASVSASPLGVKQGK